MRNVRMTIWTLVVVWVCCFGLPKAEAYLDFDDGATHTIDYRINDGFRVDYGAPGMETTVNVVSGADLYSNVYAHEDARINFLNGITNTTVNAYDRSRITLSSDIQINWFNGYGNSELTMHGDVWQDIKLYDTSSLTINGGGEIGDELYTYNNSNVYVIDGTIHHLRTSDASRVNIMGGEVVAGAVDADFRVGHESQVIISGKAFYIDDVYFGYGEITLDKYSTGHLTGHIMGGGFLDASFEMSGNGKIVLIPEPATLLLLGLSGFMLRPKR